MNPPASKWFVAPGPCLREQPLQPDERPVPPLVVRRHRHRLRRRALDIDLEVVLQVLADAGQVVDDRRRRAARGARASPTPETWSSCGELIAPPQRITSSARIVAPADLDADRARALEDDALDERARAHLEVRALHRRMQVRPRRRPAPAVRDVAVELREPLLPVAVHVVVSEWPACCTAAKNASNSGPSAGPRSRISGPSPPRHSSAPATQVSIRLKYGRQCA